MWQLKASLLFLWIKFYGNITLLCVCFWARMPTMAWSASGYVTSKVNQQALYRKKKSGCLYIEWETRKSELINWNHEWSCEQQRLPTEKYDSMVVTMAIYRSIGEKMSPCPRVPVFTNKLGKFSVQILKWLSLTPNLCHTGLFQPKWSVGYESKNDSSGWND